MIKKEKSIPTIYEQQIILACKGYGELNPIYSTRIAYSLMRGLPIDELISTYNNSYDVISYGDCFNEYYEFMQSLVQKYVDNPFNKIINEKLSIKFDDDFIDLEDNKLKPFIKLLSTVDEKKYGLSPDYKILNYMAKEILNDEILELQYHITSAEKRIENLKKCIEKIEKGGV
jgi:hypothetical protein